MFIFRFFDLSEFIACSAVIPLRGGTETVVFSGLSWSYKIIWESCIKETPLFGTCSLTILVVLSPLHFDVTLNPAFFNVSSASENVLPVTSVKIFVSKLESLSDELVLVEGIPK